MMENAHSGKNEETDVSFKSILAVVEIKTLKPIATPFTTLSAYLITIDTRSPPPEKRKT